MKSIFVTATPIFVALFFFFLSLPSLYLSLRPLSIHLHASPYLGCFVVFVLGWLVSLMEWVWLWLWLCDGRVFPGRMCDMCCV